MFILFNSSRQVNIKLCWIFVMGALPLFGTLIYLIFGTCPYDKKTWKAAKEYTKSYNRYEDYEFTKKEIIEILGYKVANDSAYDLVSYLLLGLPLILVKQIQ